MIDEIKKNSFNARILLISLILYAICYILLTQIFMFWETSWHIEGAKRMLSGGTYLSNLYDDNSPAVFMFYLPYALLSKVSVLSNYKFAFVYILLVYGIASYFTYQILKSKCVDAYARNTLYFVSMAWTLFFGITILGERESIIFCLLIPYLYMNLLEGGTISKTNQGATSFLGAIAVLQTPFYIIVPLALDIIDCVSHRRKPALYQSLFYVFFIVITVISYLLYPDYYTFLLKLLYHFQAGINEPIRDVIGSSLFLYVLCSFLITIIFAVFFYRKLIYVKIISITLFTSLIYVLEHKAWFYHIYPAICSTILAFTIIHIDNKNSVNKNLFQFVSKKVLIILYGLILLMYLAGIISSYIENYQEYNNKNSILNRLVQFSQSTNPNDNKTLFFDTRVLPAYLLKLYAHLNVISPWANNWMLPALIKFKNHPNQIKGYFIGKKMLFQMTSNTLVTQQPKYIIYFKAEHVPYIVEKNFDVIDYLKQNKTIRHELKKYTRYHRIDGFIILKRKSKK